MYLSEEDVVTHVTLLTLRSYNVQQFHKIQPLNNFVFNHFCPNDTLKNFGNVFNKRSATTV